LRVRGQEGKVRLGKYTKENTRIGKIRKTTRGGETLRERSPKRKEGSCTQKINVHLPVPSDKVSREKTEATGPL